MLVLLPWWLTLAGGLVLFVILHGPQASGHTSGPDALENTIRTLMMTIGMWACFAASFVSAIRTLWRKLLFASAKDIESIRAMSCWEFEKLVGEAYRRQGYSVEERGGRGADGGVDVLLRRDGQKIIVQCKQWRTWKVGVSVVREMFGVMVGEHADRVVIVTSGSFTKDACAFAHGKPIELVDGNVLVRLIRDVKTTQPASSSQAAEPHQPERACRVSETPICPECGSPMVLRTARKGPNAGHEFWGCPRYPACRGIVNIG